MWLQFPLLFVGVPILFILQNVPIMLCPFCSSVSSGPQDLALGDRRARLRRNLVHLPMLVHELLGLLLLFFKVPLSEFFLLLSFCFVCNYSFRFLQLVFLFSPIFNDFRPVLKVCKTGDVLLGYPFHAEIKGLIPLVLLLLEIRFVVSARMCVIPALFDDRVLIDVLALVVH